MTSGAFGTVSFHGVAMVIWRPWTHQPPPPKKKQSNEKRNFFQWHQNTRNGVLCIELLLMEEILHQLIGSISHYLQGFIHPRWCRISSINSMILWLFVFLFLKQFRISLWVCQPKTDGVFWGIFQRLVLIEIFGESPSVYSYRLDGRWNQTTVPSHLVKRVLLFLLKGHAWVCYEVPLAKGKKMKKWIVMREIKNTANKNLRKAMVIFWGACLEPQVLHFPRRKTIQDRLQSKQVGKILQQATTRQHRWLS